MNSAVKEISNKEKELEKQLLRAEKNAKALIQKERSLFESRMATLKAEHNLTTAQLSEELEDEKKQILMHVSSQTQQEVTALKKRYEKNLKAALRRAVSDIRGTYVQNK